jgi:hypothetical protein
MGEERPTGLSCEEAEVAAASGGTVAFEGRKARVVSFRNRVGMYDVSSAQLELDLGEAYLTLRGYCARNGEFIEEGRENPFRGDA